MTAGAPPPASSSSSLPLVSWSLLGKTSTLLPAAGLCPQGVVAARRLVPGLAAVQQLSGEEDPDGGHIPADSQAVEAGGGLQWLPHLHHSGVQQPGELVESLHTPLHDLGARDGFRHALPGRREDDVSAERSAPSVLLSLRSHASVLGRESPLVLSSSGAGLQSAQGETQQVADLAAVFDADLWSVRGEAAERTDRRLLLHPSLPVVLHLQTEETPTVRKNII